MCPCPDLLTHELCIPARPRNVNLLALARACLLLCGAAATCLSCAQITQIRDGQWLFRAKQTSGQVRVYSFRAYTMGLSAQVDLYTTIRMETERIDQGVATIRVIRDPLTAIHRRHES